MFGKKCGQCGKRIKAKFLFCPYCGNNSIDRAKEEKDYGLLGRSDFNQPQAPAQNIPRFPASNSIMDKMLSGLVGNMMKMVEKEVQNNIRRENPTVRNNSNFQLFINGKKVNIPSTNEEVMEKKKIKREKVNFPMPSAEVIKRSAKLPRKEAKTKLTREDDKIIYEMESPGVTSFENVLINKLEDSFEVKTFAKDKVFFKNIPIKLPLIKAYFGEGKLFLEFQAK
jgi:hypothetical protein